MKQIFEIGDRVELVDATYIEDFLGSTGTVVRVEHEKDCDGFLHTVSFEMDVPPYGAKQGYTITTDSDSLKYLGREDPQEIAHALRVALTRMGENINLLPKSSYESILRHNAKQALKALWLVANLKDYVNPDTKPEVNRPVVELKKKLLAKLAETV